MLSFVPILLMVLVFYFLIIRPANKQRKDHEELLKSLKENEDAIVNELIECQGDKVDLGGYWMPDPAKVGPAMKPSATLNKILES